MTRLQQIRQHQAELRQCRACTDMVPPVVVGEPVVSDVLLIGQAPGMREGEFGRPFAWTAGRTLFGWFQSIGVDEAVFRQRVYMSAVCRCFPGKSVGGGDRVPNMQEIRQCSRWINREIDILRPALILPVGKLAIGRYLDAAKLVDVVGQKITTEVRGIKTDLIALPHPSGASTWHRMSPGKELLAQALSLIAQHPSWRALVDSQ
jgi:uracil-DNA glycosylase